MKSIRSVIVLLSATSACFAQDTARMEQVIQAAVQAKTGDAQTRQLFELAYGGVTTIGRVLPHSRGNESEADKMGAIYAARAGYDPRAAITFWEKMMAQKQAAEKASGGEDKISALFSTHPADQKRIADLKALMPSVLPIYEQNKGKYSGTPAPQE